MKSDRWRVLFQIAGAIAFAVYSVCGAFNQNVTWLIDGTNLLFHEAGHVFFSFLGEWMHFVGGTLLQLLFPLSLAVFFFLKKNPYAAAMMLIWFGQNFSGVSIYIGDARAQALPLVGGERHDWNYLLGSVNLLEDDQAISALVWFTGLFIIIGAAVFSVRAVVRKNDVMTRTGLSGDV